VEISDMHIQVGPGKDTAVASYILQVRTKLKDGKVSDEHNQESDVMFKRNGEWKYGMNLDLAVDIGGYEAPKKAEQPILVRMERTPCLPGLPERDQHRAGRGDLLSTPFEMFERSIRDQFARVLGEAGFDPANEITASDHRQSLAAWLRLRIQLPGRSGMGEGRESMRNWPQTFWTDRDREF
jgi:hypothetical protein